MPAKVVLRVKACKRRVKWVMSVSLLCGVFLSLKARGVSAGFDQAEVKGDFKEWRVDAKALGHGFVV
jgi:hypothetical protein